MRNNQDRLSVAGGQDPPVPAIEQAQNNVSTFSFATPTEFVELPSQGELYPEGHPLKGIKTIEIRHMTAKDEDILTSQALIQSGVVLERLLQNVIVDKTINIDDFLVGDKNALLKACRQYGYGPLYEVEVRCPSCQSECAYEFDISKWKNKECDIESSGIKKTENNTFLIILPFSGVDVEFRLMTSRDEKKMENIGERNKKLKLPESSATDFLKALIVSVNGYSDMASIFNFVESVPAMDAKILRSAYAAATPDVESKNEFVCPKCSYCEVMEVPLSINFFWPEL